MRAQEREGSRQLRIVRRERASIAEAEKVLRGKEAEHRDLAQRPRAATVKRGSRRLGGVLDQRDASLPRAGRDLVERRRCTKQIDRDDRLG